MGLITCPLPAALTTIPASSCPVKFDQVVKMAFQRSGQTSFADLTALQTLATWTPLLAAVNSTKVIVTPYFASLSFPPSEAQEEGGNDNTTVNGIPVYKGEGFVQITGVFEGLTKAQYQALKKLTQESFNLSGGTNLTVFFFNRFGQILHDMNGAEPRGFALYNFRMATVGSEGYNANNKYNFSMQLSGEWDDNATLTQPTDFSALTLAN